MSVTPSEIESLYNRIIQAGLGLADRKLVANMMEDVPKIQTLLQKWGITFDSSGPYHLGYPFIHAIEKDVRSSAIRLFEHTMITDLLLHDDKCVGAMGITTSGEILVFQTPAVILATGGDAQLFRHNVHPDCVTGDGYAMGFRAGAELMNMEFMQIFFCTVHPTRNLFHAWHEEVLKNIYNKEGYHFLPDYLPADISVEECLEENVRHAPFSTRDRASRYLGIAIVKEIQAGRGTEHGGIFFALTDRAIDFPENQERFLRSRDVDIRNAPVQITMGHQCSNGGLRIDTNAMTSVPGVFTAGETTTGMHGADRLGGNMLSACLIFGVRAAESATDWAKTHPVDCDITQVAQEKLDELSALSSSIGTTKPDELLCNLQQSAWDNALTIRSEESLTTLLSDIRQLREEYHHALSVQTPADFICALELRNLLLVGELVATAAMRRKESRGGHYREDYSDCNYHEPARAIILNALEDQSIQVREEVIDPDWRYDEEYLGKKRWG
jgi:succinate dehydrogenase/fumarate reductase flavoprotein subunit